MEPAAQSAQATLPVSLANVPGPHGWHSTCPATGCTEPASQASQLSRVAVPLRPASQGRHSVLLLRDVYFPASHDLQRSVWLSLNLPAAHAAHLIEARLLSDLKPAAQGSHSVLPAAALNMPVAQFSHACASSVLEKRPGAQATHSMPTWFCPSAHDLYCSIMASALI